MTTAFCGTCEYLENIKHVRFDNYVNELQIGDFIVPVVDTEGNLFPEFYFDKNSPIVYQDIKDDIKYCIQQMISEQMLFEHQMQFLSKEPYLAYIIRQQFDGEPDSNVAVQYGNMKHIAEGIKLIYKNAAHQYKFVPADYKSSRMYGGIDTIEHYITIKFIKETFNEHKKNISKNNKSIKYTFEAPLENDYMIIRKPMVATLISS